ncbi:MAG: hypothetical protein R2762_18835 [Bryobacteraceae bacterium]
MLRWLFMAVAVLAAQDSAPEPAYPGIHPDVLRIARIKTRMRENLTQLPNYTCTETIERSHRAPKSRRFQLDDTIRLEVALVNGKELFAWPGAGNFEDRPLRDLVGGTIGNGSFALHARSVFLSNAPTYEYVGPVEEFGRSMHRYRYHVPLNRSGFQLRVGDQQGVAGYHGAFDVDQTSLDLIRLEVIAHDIPPHVPLSNARDEMRYQRVAIGERDFLLPQSSELTLTDLTGDESRNRTSFSSCHQYSGESTISFDDPPPPGEAPPPPVAAVPVQLPEGLLFEARLTEALQFKDIAIGDPFEVELTTNAKQGKSTIVPRGAKARGRVTGYRRFYNRFEQQLLSLRIEEIEFPGARADVVAVPVDIRIPAAGPTAVGKTGMIYMRGQRQGLMKGTQIVWRVEPKTTETGRHSQ